MPLIYFHTDKIYSHIIWQIIEDEKFFFSKFSLNKRELKIYNLKKTTSKKIEFLSVRYLLRLLKLKPNDLYYLKNGAPKLKSKNNLSISHCNGYSTVLISELSCGVDIETFRNKIFKVKDRFLNEFDIKNIDIKSVFNLTAIWCLKESVFKAENNTGLSFKNQIFIKSIEKKSKSAELFVKRLDSDIGYKCNLLFNSKYICTTVFSND